MEKNPNIKKWLLRAASYILVAALASACTMAIFGGESKLEQLERIITNRFVGESDTTAMGDMAATGMIASLGDRWSYYIPAADYESLMESKNNAYVGIGITVAARTDGAGFDILRVEPGSSALEAGILPGDVLVEVQGVSLVGLEIASPAQYIKGEEGTQVTVTVLRGEERLSFTAERREIKTQVAAGEMLPGDVGYIKIANFHDHCAEQTIACIEELMAQEAKALIFDVRNNAGGYRSELVEVLDYLLPEGELMRNVGSDGRETINISDASCIALPMAVLINGESYSAAEFFAAVLSEYGWAKTVGTPTCGKSYFQQTIRLSDGSAVSLSVGAYYTPNGVSLAEVGGLIPDIEVALDETLAAESYAGLIDPMDDPQVLAALELLG